MSQAPTPYIRNVSLVDKNPDTGVWRWCSDKEPIFGSGVAQGLAINFRFHGKYKSRDAVVKLEHLVQGERFDWIRAYRKCWYINTEAFRNYLGTAHVYEGISGVFGVNPFEGLDWLKGVITLEPEVEYDYAIGVRVGNHPPAGPYDYDTIITFRVMLAEYWRDMNRKVFLSHKGADKPLVRDFHKTLQVLGFDPWIDEDAMPAGTTLERGILQGFKESCAAVFFVTPKYKDQGFLATEVEYALAEQREKGENRFKIISIVFKGESGKLGEVPDLLKNKVWKTPRTRLEALREIVRALPIEVGPPVWKVR